MLPRPKTLLTSKGRAGTPVLLAPAPQVPILQAICVPSERLPPGMNVCWLIMSRQRRSCRSHASDGPAKWGAASMLAFRHMGLCPVYVRQQRNVRPQPPHCQLSPRRSGPIKPARGVCSATYGPYRVGPGRIDAFNGRNGRRHVYASQHTEGCRRLDRPSRVTYRSRARRTVAGARIQLPVAAQGVSRSDATVSRCESYLSIDLWFPKGSRSGRLREGLPADLRLQTRVRTFASSASQGMRIVGVCIAVS